MAARRKRSDAPAVPGPGDEDAIDPVEADDVDDTDELEDDDLPELDEELDDEDAFDEDDDEDDGSADGEDEESIEVPLEEGLEPDEDDPSAPVPAVPAEAAFDDDDEARAVAAVVNEDDDDSEIDGLRDEEFVCRSCYMAKRDSQLADPERMLCRDCA